MAALLANQRGWDAMLGAARRRDRFTAGRLLRDWLTPGAGPFVVKQVALAAAETYLAHVAAVPDDAPPMMHQGIAGHAVEDAAHEMLSAAINVVIDPTIERRAVTLDRAARRYAESQDMPGLIGGYLLSYIGDLSASLDAHRVAGDAAV
jgi:hypothetical protein